MRKAFCSRARGCTSCHRERSTYWWASISCCACATALGLTAYEAIRRLSLVAQCVCRANPRGKPGRHAGRRHGDDETKARYAFVYGDFRRVHRMGLIACHYRAAEWRHKEVELAAHELLQYLDRKSAR